MQKPIKSEDIPAKLTFYSGGLNLGIFYPGPPVGNEGSQVLGNPLTGISRTYNSVSSGNGNKRHGWLLIVAPTDVENFQFRLSTMQTGVTKISNYDGYYNKLNSTRYVKDRISKYQKGGYKDWYIPSRDELAFMAKNIPLQFDLGIRFYQMNPVKYASSTYAEQNIRSEKSGKKLSLVYAQSFDEPTYGDTLLVSDTIPMSVRLVRRVPFYII